MDKSGSWTVYFKGDVSDLNKKVDDAKAKVKETEKALDSKDSGGKGTEFKVKPNIDDALKALQTLKSKFDEIKPIITVNLDASASLGKLTEACKNARIKLESQFKDIPVTFKYTEEVPKTSTKRGRPPKTKVTDETTVATKQNSVGVTIKPKVDLTAIDEAIKTITSKIESVKPVIKVTLDLNTSLQNLLAESKKLRLDIKNQFKEIPITFKFTESTPRVTKKQLAEQAKSGVDTLSEGKQGSEKEVFESKTKILSATFDLLNKRLSTFKELNNLSVNVTFPNARDTISNIQKLATAFEKLNKVPGTLYKIVNIKGNFENAGKIPALEQIATFVGAFKGRHEITVSLNVVDKLQSLGYLKDFWNTLNKVLRKNYSNIVVDITFKSLGDTLKNIESLQTRLQDIASNKNIKIGISRENIKKELAEVNKIILDFVKDTKGVFKIDLRFTDSQVQKLNENLAKIDVPKIKNLDKTAEGLRKLALALKNIKNLGKVKFVYDADSFEGVKSMVAKIKDQLKFLNSPFDIKVKSSADSERKLNRLLKLLRHIQKLSIQKIKFTADYKDIRFAVKAIKEKLKDKDLKIPIKVSASLDDKSVKVPQNLKSLLNNLNKLRAKRDLKTRVIVDYRSLTNAIVQLDNLKKLLATINLPRGNTVHNIVITTPGITAAASALDVLVKKLTKLKSLSNVRILVSTKGNIFSQLGIPTGAGGGGNSQPGLGGSTRQNQVLNAFGFSPNSNNPAGGVRNRNPYLNPYSFGDIFSSWRLINEVGRASKGIGSLFEVFSYNLRDLARLKDSPLNFAQFSRSGILAPLLRSNGLLGRSYFNSRLDAINERRRSVGKPELSESQVARLRARFDQGNGNVGIPYRTLGTFFSGFSQALAPITVAAFGASAAFEVWNTALDMSTRYLKTFVDVLSRALTPGIKLMNEIKTSELAMRASLQSMTSVNGQSTTKEQAEGAVRKLMGRVIVDAQNSAFSVGEITEALRGTLGMLFGKGMTLEQAYNITKGVASVAKVSGLSRHQVLQETRDLAQGSITARTSQVANLLGITNEDLAQFKGDQEALYNFLQEKFKNYVDIMEEYSKTPLGAFERLQETIALAGKTVVERFADPVVSAFNYITDSLGYMADEAGRKITFDSEGNALDEYGHKVENVTELHFELSDSVKQAVRYISEIILHFIEAAESVLSYGMEVTETNSIGAMFVSISNKIIDVLEICGKLFIWGADKAYTLGNSLRYIGMAAAGAATAVLAITTAVKGLSAIKNIRKGSFLEGFGDLATAITTGVGAFGTGAATYGLYELGDIEKDSLSDSYKNTELYNEIQELKKSLKDIDFTYKGSSNNTDVGLSDIVGNKKPEKEDDKAKKAADKAAKKAQSDWLKQQQKMLKDTLANLKELLQDKLDSLKEILEDNEIAFDEGFKSYEDYIVTKAGTELEEAEAELAERIEARNRILQTEYENEYDKQKDLHNVNREIESARKKMERANAGFEQIVGRCGEISDEAKEVVKPLRQAYKELSETAGTLAPVKQNIVEFIDALHSVKVSADNVANSINDAANNIGSVQVPVVPSRGAVSSDVTSTKNEKQGYEKNTYGVNGKVITGKISGLTDSSSKSIYSSAHSVLSNAYDDFIKSSAENIKGKPKFVEQALRYLFAFKSLYENSTNAYAKSFKNNNLRDVVGTPNSFVNALYGAGISEPGDFTTKNIQKLIKHIGGSGINGTTINEIEKIIGEKVGKMTFNVPLIYEKSPSAGDSGSGNYPEYTMKVIRQTAKECTRAAMSSIYDYYTGENTTSEDFYSWYDKIRNGRLKAEEHNFSKYDRQGFEQLLTSHFDQYPDRPVYIYQAGGDGSYGTHKENRGVGTHAYVVWRLPNGRYRVFNSNGGEVNDRDLSEIFDPTANGGDEYSSYPVGNGNNVFIPTIDPVKKLPKVNTSAKSVNTSSISGRDDQNFTKKENDLWRYAQRESDRLFSLTNFRIEPEMFYRQWMYESANGTSELAKKDHNYGGLTYYKVPTKEELLAYDPNLKNDADFMARGIEVLRQPEAGANGYYRHYKSDEDYRRSFINDFVIPRIKRGDLTAENVSSVESYATAMYNSGYFKGNLPGYISGMRSKKIPNTKGYVLSEDGSKLTKIESVTKDIQLSLKDFEDGLTSYIGKSMENLGNGCVEAVTKMGLNFNSVLRKAYGDNITEVEDFLNFIDKSGVEREKFIKGKTKLRPGDVVSWGKEHVAMVKSVDQKTGKVTGIGNVGEGVSAKVEEIADLLDYAVNGNGISEVIRTGLGSKFFNHKEHIDDTEISYSGNKVNYNGIKVDDVDFDKMSGSITSNVTTNVSANKTAAEDKKLRKQYRQEYEDLVDTLRSGRTFDVVGNLSGIVRQFDRFVSTFDFKIPDVDDYGNYDFKRNFYDAKVREFKNKVREQNVNSYTQGLNYNLEELSRQLEGFAYNISTGLDDANRVLRMFGEKIQLPKGLNSIQSWTNMNGDVFNPGYQISMLKELAYEYFGSGNLDKYAEIRNTIEETYNKLSDFSNTILDSVNKQIDWQKSLFDSNDNFTTLQHEIGDRQFEAWRNEAEFNHRSNLQIQYQEQLSEVMSEIQMLEEEQKKLNFASEEYRKIQQRINDENMHANRIKQLMQENHYLKEQNRLLKDQPTLLKDIKVAAKDAFEDGLVTFLTDGITGSESLGDAFRSMIKNILVSIQKVNAKWIAQSISSMLFGRHLTEPYRPNWEQVTPTFAKGLSSYNDISLTTEDMEWMTNQYDIGKENITLDSSLFDGLEEGTRKYRKEYKKQRKLADEIYQESIKTFYLMTPKDELSKMSQDDIDRGITRTTAYVANSRGVRNPINTGMTLEEQQKEIARAISWEESERVKTPRDIPQKVKDFRGRGAFAVADSNILIRQRQIEDTKKSLEDSMVSSINYQKLLDEVNKIDSSDLPEELKRNKLNELLLPRGITPVSRDNVKDYVDEARNILSNKVSESKSKLSESIVKLNDLGGLTLSEDTNSLVNKIKDIESKIAEDNEKLKLKAEELGIKDFDVNNIKKEDLDKNKDIKDLYDDRNKLLEERNKLGSYEESAFNDYLNQNEGRKQVLSDAILKIDSKDVVSEESLWLKKIYELLSGRYTDTRVQNKSNEENKLIQKTETKVEPVGTNKIVPITQDESTLKNTKSVLDAMRNFDTYRYETLDKLDNYNFEDESLYYKSGNESNDDYVSRVKGITNKEFEFVDRLIDSYDKGLLLAKDASDVIAIEELIDLKSELGKSLNSDIIDTNNIGNLFKNFSEKLFVGDAGLASRLFEFKRAEDTYRDTEGNPNFGKGFDYAFVKGSMYNYASFLGESLSKVNPDISKYVESYKNAVSSGDSSKIDETGNELVVKLDELIRIANSINTDNGNSNKITPIQTEQVSSIYNYTTDSGENYPYKNFNKNVFGKQLDGWGNALATVGIQNTKGKDYWDSDEGKSRILELLKKPNILSNDEGVVESSLDSFKAQLSTIVNAKDSNGNYVYDEKTREFAQAIIQVITDEGDKIVRAIVDLANNNGQQNVNTAGENGNVKGMYGVNNGDGTITATDLTTGEQKTEKLKEENKKTSNSFMDEMITMFKSLFSNLKSLLSKLTGGLSDVLFDFFSSLLGGVFGGGTKSLKSSVDVVHDKNTPGGKGLATGGVVTSSGVLRGPGTGTSDSIPTMLSNGEGIIKAERVRQLGANFIHAVNSGNFAKIRSKIPHFADGGVLGNAGVENTARGISSFAQGIGSHISSTNKFQIALVRDEQEAMREFMRGGEGQRIMLDFSKKNAAFTSRISKSF